MTVWLQMKASSLSHLHVYECKVTLPVQFLPQTILRLELENQLKVY